MNPLLTALLLYVGVGVAFMLFSLPFMPSRDEDMSAFAFLGYLLLVGAIWPLLLIFWVLVGLNSASEAILSRIFR